MSVALDLPVVVLARPLPLRVVPAPLSCPPYDDEVATAPVLRLVTEPHEDYVADDSPWFHEDLTPAAELPDPRQAADVLLRGLLEVMSGTRPLLQLRRLLDVELFAAIRERMENGRATSTQRPVQRPLRSVHAQTRPEGVSEVCACVLRNGRLVAVALRLEGRYGAWVCTALEGL